MHASTSGKRCGDKEKEFACKTIAKKNVTATYTVSFAVRFINRPYNSRVHWVNKSFISHAHKLYIHISCMCIIDEA